MTVRGANLYIFEIDNRKIYSLDIPQTINSMKFSRIIALLLSAVVLSLGLMSCDDDIADPVEDPTTFLVEVTNVGPINPVLKSGTFSSPGAGSIGPDLPALFPGESASFTFTAPPSTLTPLGGSGQRLNLATMFVQSNDLFYAFPPEGLDLYDENDNAVTGDVTDQIFLYDAGTEEDTAPGTGPNQKPAQDGSATDQGPDENENVTLISNAETNDFNYPDKSEVIQVTIDHDGGVEFTVTVTNVSQPGTIDSQRAGGSVPLSPGSWAVYENALEANGPFAFYELGAPASQGIEFIAEDGFPADVIANGDIDTPIDMGLADGIAQVTGVTTPLSPPVIFSHEDGFEFYQLGEPLGEPVGEGIETVAEDGFPASELGGNNLPPGPNEALLDLLQGEEAVISAGAAPNPGRIVPALEPTLPGNETGESGSFEVTAAPGDRLNFATMYVQSNDFFYAFPPNGIALFNDNGTPVSGDVTDQLALYDAGTEVDEEPGVGLTQKARQGFTRLDVGEEENGSVQLVVGPGEDGGSNDNFNYPANNQIIRVTITPQPDGAQ